MKQPVRLGSPCVSQNTFVTSQPPLYSLMLTLGMPLGQGNVYVGHLRGAPQHPALGARERGPLGCGRLPLRGGAGAPGGPQVVQGQRRPPRRQDLYHCGRIGTPRGWRDVVYAYSWVWGDVLPRGLFAAPLSCTLTFFSRPIPQLLW